MNCHLDPAFYTERERSYEEILPWDFIRIGVTKKFLWNENGRRAQKEEVTKNCRARLFRMRSKCIWRRCML